jgi:Pup amidohydrolase
VAAVKQISADPSFAWQVKRASGRSIGAVDIQRVYLLAAQEKLTGLSPETDLVLTEWEQVLDRLESDPLGLSDTLDWAAKYALLNEFRESENLSWSDPYLQSLDLEYHNVDPGAGLYLALEQEGRVRRVVTDSEVQAALKNPPAGSPRAIARGIAACRFPEAVSSVTWSRMTLTDGDQARKISLARLGEADPVAVTHALNDVHTPAAFVAALDGLLTPGEDSEED